MNEGFFCTPDTIRTYDLRLRRALLYPAELPGHIKPRNLMNCLRLLKVNTKIKN